MHNRFSVILLKGEIEMGETKEMVEEICEDIYVSRISGIRFDSWSQGRKNMEKRNTIYWVDLTFKFHINLFLKSFYISETLIMISSLIFFI